MTCWLIKLVLAARSKSEDDGWSQILVFVILAIFYAVGSIISKAKKAAKNGKGQKPKPGKPVRKQPELTIDLRMLKQLFGLPEEPEEAKSGIQTGQEEEFEQQAAKPQVAKQKIHPTVRKVSRSQPVVRKAPETSQIMGMEPQVQPKLEKVPGLTGESEVLTGTPQTKYLSDILSDYEDAEKLRRAILHYEILGKPLSLREPLERFF
jgi:hypothetical protein